MDVTRTGSDINPPGQNPPEQTPPPPDKTPRTKPHGQNPTDKTPRTKPPRQTNSNSILNYYYYYYYYRITPADVTNDAFIC